MGLPNFWVRLRLLQERGGEEGALSWSRQSRSRENLVRARHSQSRKPCAAVVYMFIYLQLQTDTPLPRHGIHRT